MPYSPYGTPPPRRRMGDRRMPDSGQPSPRPMRTGYAPPRQNPRIMQQRLDRQLNRQEAGRSYNPDRIAKLQAGLAGPNNGGRGPGWEHPPGGPSWGGTAGPYYPPGGTGKFPPQGPPSMVDPIPPWAATQPGPPNFNPPPTPPGPQLPNQLNPATVNPATAPAPTPVQQPQQQGYLPATPQSERDYRVLNDQLSAQLAQLGIQQSQIQPMVDMILGRMNTGAQTATNQLNEGLAERGMLQSGTQDFLYNRDILQPYQQAGQDLSQSVAQQLANLSNAQAGAYGDFQSGMMDSLLNQFDEAMMNPGLELQGMFDDMMAQFQDFFGEMDQGGGGGGGRNQQRRRRRNQRRKARRKARRQRRRSRRRR